MNEEKKFYVYAWYYKSTGKYFHIGKGTGNRYKETKNSRNEYFKNIVNKYKDEVDSKILFDSLSEKEALDLERKLIKEYKSIGWCQTNLHEGGCGGNTGNYQVVGQKIKEYRATHKMTEKQAEVVRMMNERVRGTHQTEEHKNNIRLANPRTLQYDIYYNNELIKTCYGRRALYSFCQEKFNVGHGVIDGIVQGQWTPKFKKHQHLINLKIITSKIESVSTNPDECKDVE
jgi:hypothetical protein